MSIKTKLKSLFGMGSDIYLPDEKAGKPVRSMSGGMTKGGAPDDYRWKEHNKRKAAQAMKNIQDLGQHVRRVTGADKKKK